VHEAQADGGDGSSEAVVEATPRHLQASRPHRYRGAEPPWGRSARQQDAHARSNRDLEGDPRRGRPGGLRAIEEGEPGCLCADRGAQLERGRNAGAFEGPAPEKTVHGNPGLEATARSRPTEDARGKASPPLPFVGGETKPLDADRHGDRTQGALEELEPGGGLARAGTQHRHAVEFRPEMRSRELGVELIVREAVGAVEERATGAGAPPLGPFLLSG